MAERRMFAKTVVESDMFISMSIKAQNLYYQLNMKADDDGFLNNSLSICRSLGFTKKALDELIEKRFVLDLGDGITVIKHWLINNRIQKDRYKPTIYQEKYQLLSIKEDKGYTLLDNKRTTNGHKNENMDNKWTQNGQQLCTQVSIGKDSIGKYSDDDINNINMRMLEIGTEPKTIDKALKIFANKQYPKTSGFYQRIINTLVDNKIYDKEAYISEIARNYVLD